MAHRISPTIYELEWSYDLDAYEGLGFRVQYAEVSNGIWKDIEVQPAPEQHRVTLLGEDAREKYYRVRAYAGKDCKASESYSGCAFSAYTETVLVTESTAYRADLNFTLAPVLDIFTVVNKGFDESVGDTTVVGASSFIAVTTDQIAKAVYLLPYTKSVVYEFRIIRSQDEQEAVITKPYTTDGSATIVRNFTSHAEACYDSRDTYVQVRAVWTEVDSYDDTELGGIAYTEWSDLSRWGGSIDCSDVSN